jgi:protein-disulfide isomerase
MVKGKISGVWQSIKGLSTEIKVAYGAILVLFAWNIANIFCTKDVGKWVAKNPEAILTSVNTYVTSQQEQNQRDQQSQAGENIGKYKDELFDEKHAGIINPKGSKVIVEFFDYNCGYCKMVSKNVAELLKNRSDVRIVLKAIPILGDASRYASEVGVAITILDAKKYVAYYEELMTGSAGSQEGVRKAVEKAGLKFSAVEKAMSNNKSEIDKILSDNLSLAGRVGVNGTPAFIVGETLLPGAVDAGTLSSVVDDQYK